MPPHPPQGRKLVAEFPNATAVFVVGDFNRWGTGSTPMQRRSDGRWEVALPGDADPGRLAYWVWSADHIGGRLCREDWSAVGGESAPGISEQPE